MIMQPMFEVRALPRKRKEVEEAEQQPVFLKKVFSMINSCPDEIGGWADHGETFIIRDANRFALELIPTAFKHNKFTSFVRQLNFYGFRKVKPDASHQAHWWEFRHPYFRRDEPQLLSKIRKSMQFDANGEEIINENPASVKEIEDLKSKVAELESTVLDLTSLVRSLLQGQPNTILPSHGDGANKKRKTSAVELCGKTVDLSRPDVEDCFQDPMDVWGNLESIFGESQFDQVPRFDSEPVFLSNSAVPDTTTQPVKRILESGFVFTPELSSSLQDSAPRTQLQPVKVETKIESVAHSIGASRSVIRLSGPIIHRSLSDNLCLCSNCQLVSVDGVSEVPVVAYSLAAATVGAMCAKYGESIVRSGSFFHEANSTAESLNLNNGTNGVNYFSL